MTMEPIHFLTRRSKANQHTSVSTVYNKLYIGDQPVILQIRF